MLEFIPYLFTAMGWLGLAIWINDKALIEYILLILLIIMVIETVFILVTTKVKKENFTRHRLFKKFTKVYFFLITGVVICSFYYFLQ